jgi:hypothetical protein
MHAYTTNPVQQCTQTLHPVIIICCSNIARKRPIQSLFLKFSNAYRNMPIVSYHIFLQRHSTAILVHYPASSAFCWSIIPKVQQCMPRPPIVFLSLISSTTQYRPISPLSQWFSILMVHYLTSSAFCLLIIPLVQLIVGPLSHWLCLATKKCRIRQPIYA